MKHLIKRGRSVWPWEDFERAVERLYGEPKFDIASSEACDWVPAIDIKDERDNYVITADIPGVDPKKVEIKLEHDILSIRGEREVEKREEHKEFVRMERSYGSFYRSFQLADADAEHIKANCKDGVLRITIPKTSKRTSRKIEIQEA